jgi:hypothetical protein
VNFARKTSDKRTWLLKDLGQLLLVMFAAELLIALDLAIDGGILSVVQGTLILATKRNVGKDAK